MSRAPRCVVIESPARTGGDREGARARRSSPAGQTAITEYRRFVACEIGYVLGATARWRRSPAGIAAFGDRGICWCDVCFRPRRRIVGTLIVRGRPYEAVVVRFVPNRPHRRLPYWYRRYPSPRSPVDDRPCVDTGRKGSLVEEPVVATTPSSCAREVQVCGLATSNHETVESRSEGQTSASGDGDGENDKDENDDVLVGRGESTSYVCSPAVFPDLSELRERIDRKFHIKWASVDASMILCSDEIAFINRIAASGQRGRLRYFTKRFHGSCVMLSWPTGWVFTVTDASRSPRLRKVGVAVVRDGHVCCDFNLTPVGVVHDVGSEHDETEFPVVLLGDDGFVYLYDDGGVSPVLYLLTKGGFEDFCRRGLRERAVTERNAGSSPVDYDEEPFRSLLESRHSLDELVKVRRRLMGVEAAVFHTDNVWTFLRISDLTDLGYGDEEFDKWTKESGHLRLEPMFTVKAYVDDVWVDSPVLISDAGTLFYVDRFTSRLKFLAADLHTFLVLGLVRYRSSSFYLRGSFPVTKNGTKIEPKRKDVSSPMQGRTRGYTSWRCGAGFGSPFDRPVYCPRGHNCRRRRGGGFVGTGRSLAGRAWCWLRGAWGRMMKCCRG